MSETKTITGACSEISERGEWTTFHIDTGGQWPLKLSTMLQPIIELGRAASKAGGAYTWKYSESEGKVNPNTGKPFINRRLEGVEPASASPTDDRMTKDEWRRKDSAADKRALTAIAVSALQHTMPSDPSTEDLNKFMERVAHLTIAWQRVIDTVRDGEDMAPFEEAQAPALSAHDDGIPFD